MDYSFQKLRIVIAGVAATLGIFAIPHISLAAAQFNGNNIVQVSNYTNCQGTGCWASSANAAPGDTVSFVIYVENVGNETAINTQVRFQFTQSGNQIFATGYLSADNASQVTGSATVNIIGGQTTLNTVPLITFNIRTYPAPYSETTIDGSSIASGGTSIDGIVAGYYGSLVSRFQVNSAQGGGSAPAVSSASASNVTESSATVSATVNPSGLQTNYWIEYGITQSLGSLTVQNSAGAGTTNQSISVPLSSLSSNTTYYYQVVAQNSVGTTRSALLSFTTLSIGGGGGVGGGNNPIVTTLSATPYTSYATLNASVNPNGGFTSARFAYGTDPANFTSYTGCSWTGSGNSNVPKSNTVYNLSTQTTYYFRVEAYRSLSCAGAGTYGDILSFTPASNSGNQGGGQTPSVSTNNATNISLNSATLQGIANPNGGSVNSWFEWGTGSFFGNTTPSYYTSGYSSNSYSYTVSGLQPNTTYYFRAVAQNTSGGGRVYGSQYTFTTNYSSSYDNTTPTVSTISSLLLSTNSVSLRGSVNPNTYSNGAYVWFEYGLTQSLGLRTADTFVNAGTSYVDFYQTVSNLSQNATYYYRAMARNASTGNYGYGQISSFSTSNTNSSVSSGTGPYVRTGAAAFVSESSAVLSGDVNPESLSTNVWFEYGQTAYLGNFTPQVSVGTGSTTLTHSASVSSLAPNIDYYFRIVGQNASGTSLGAVNFFRRTLSTTPPSSPEPGTVTVATEDDNAPECVRFTPSLSIQELEPGKSFDYIVSYQNNCAYRVTGASLKNVLPEGTGFTSTSTSLFSFNEGENEAVHTIGILEPNTSSTVAVRGFVRESIEKGQALVFNSTLNFTAPSGRIFSLKTSLAATVGEGGTGVFTANLLDTVGNLFTNPFFDVPFSAGGAYLLYWFLKKRKRMAFVRKMESNGTPLIRSTPRRV